MRNRVCGLEKFLWELYRISEILGDIFDFFPRNINDAVYPEYAKLRRNWEKRISRRSFGNLIYQLKKKGLIKEIKEKGKKAWLLTGDGEKKVLEVKYKFDEYKKRKDGKWIMIIFDIPEKIKKKRELLRRKLCFLGFKMLQKSIWICPNDVLKEVNNFIDRIFLTPHIKIFLIEELDLTNSQTSN